MTEVGTEIGRDSELSAAAAIAASTPGGFTSSRMTLSTCLTEYVSGDAGGMIPANEEARLVNRCRDEAVAGATAAAAG